MFALVDANSFYCSAEQVFRPEWRGRGIIVLSNNDGIIVARNRQAKEAGIPKFKAYFEVKELCEQRGVIALSSNYELYGSLSADMMQVIGRFAPEQHIYSIDESFLSFKNCSGAIPCLTTHAKLIRRTVWKETRLPVCVGIGETVTLAKVANHAAKKLRGYHGVCHIRSDDERQHILASMQVGEVWGIGPKIGKRLSSMGISTALQLANFAPGLAKKMFSIDIERTIRELNGEACLKWDETRAEQQQIFSTRSMGQRITDKDSLTQALCKHLGIAAQKARMQGALCSTMLIFAHNSSFDERANGFKQTHSFPFPTSDTLEMTRVVVQVAERLYQPGVRYYKIGIGLLNLRPAHNVQTDMFTQTANPALMNIYDSLNARYGNGSVFLAAQGIDPKWGMRRERLSPQYTTKWSDIPKIKC